MPVNVRFTQSKKSDFILTDLIEVNGQRFRIVSVMFSLGLYSAHKMISTIKTVKFEWLGWKLIVIFFFMAIAGSCAQVRKATYPPDFVYLEKKEVTSAMQKMAVSINKLHRMLSDTEYQQASKQQDVLTELDVIESVTRSLRTGGSQSNHPLIDQHMDNFRDQLLVAKNAAQRDPPDYYPAGRLVGQCQGCHIQR